MDYTPWNQQTVRTWKSALTPPQNKHVPNWFSVAQTRCWFQGGRNHLVSQQRIASFVSRHVSAPSFQARPVRKAPPGPLCGAQHPGPWRHGSRIACWPYGWRCGGKGWCGKRSCFNNYPGNTTSFTFWGLVRTHKFGFGGLPKVRWFQHVFYFQPDLLGNVPIWHLRIFFSSVGLTTNWTTTLYTLKFVSYLEAVEAEIFVSELLKNPGHKWVTIQITCICRGLSVIL